MFKTTWTAPAQQDYDKIKSDAERARATRQRTGKAKSSKQEGLFKQITKALKLLAENPRYPSLATHKFSSLENPYDRDQDVFEAYAQSNTPSAYRIFWCYGPDKEEITIIAITPHP